MATATLGEYKTSLRAKGYETDTATAQVEAINSARRRIIGKRRWSFLETTGTVVTVAGISTVSLASLSTLQNVDSVRIEVGTDYPEIEYLPPERLRDLAHDDRDQGTPEYWTRYGSTLRFYPTPDRVYTATVAYTIEAASLVNDGDACVIPKTYMDVVVWGAVMEMAARERDWTQYDRAHAQFVTRLAEMEGAYLIRQRQSSTHVARSMSWHRDHRFIQP